MLKLCVGYQSSAQVVCYAFFIILHLLSSISPEAFLFQKAPPQYYHFFSSSFIQSRYCIRRVSADNAMNMMFSYSTALYPSLKLSLWSRHTVLSLAVLRGHRLVPLFRRFGIVNRIWTGLFHYLLN